MLYGYGYCSMYEGMANHPSLSFHRLPGLSFALFSLLGKQGQEPRQKKTRSIAQMMQNSLRKRCYHQIDQPTDQFINQWIEPLQSMKKKESAFPKKHENRHQLNVAPSTKPLRKMEQTAKLQVMSKYKIVDFPIHIQTAKTAKS